MNNYYYKNKTLFLRYTNLSDLVSHDMKTKYSCAAVFTPHRAVRLENLTVVFLI